MAPFTNLCTPETCWKSPRFNCLRRMPSQAKESTMNDHLNSAGPSTKSPPPQQRSGRSWLILPTVALAAALTGAVATSAMSQYGDGAGMPMHFMGGGGHEFDPARAEERADRMVRHLAIEVDATNE